MRRLARVCLPLVALAVLAAPSALGAGSGPTAGAARGCHLSLYQQRHLGTTYVYTLRVHGTTCRNGRRVVRAFHACRHENGRAGRCTHRVLRYRCREARYNKSRFSYDSKVRCTRGGREVFHRYTQNL